MKYDPSKHHRRSVRLRGYDYSSPGAYFVTICAARKRSVFGKIENGVMRLHPYGRIVAECWCALAEHFPQIALDEFVVMPNHFHGIIIITSAAGDADNIAAAGRGTPEACPYTCPNERPHVCDHDNFNGAKFGGSQAGSLGVMVGQMKMHATKRINAQRAQRHLAPVEVWQRSFHDHIIRSENELNDTRRYIAENPLHWMNDENYSIPEPTSQP
jgi:REP element-mobilizing transposase RayT